MFGKFLKTERRAPDLSHDLGRFCGPHASFSSRRAHAYATHQIRSKYACPLANATPNWSGIRRIQATLTHPRTEGHAWKTWMRGVWCQVLHLHAVLVVSRSTGRLIGDQSHACMLNIVYPTLSSFANLSKPAAAPARMRQHCLPNFVIFRKPIKPRAKRPSRDFLELLLFVPLI